VIKEIEKEDSATPELFVGALRHQIVFSCQHLRVCLAAIDQLMSEYNKVMASKNSSAAPN
jgi:hypothetical protein